VHGNGIFSSTGDQFGLFITRFVEARDAQITVDDANVGNNVNISVKLEMMITKQKIFKKTFVERIGI
jgi:hypothetical protein